MRIRHDVVFISSVLMTISLLALAPHNLSYASTWRRRFFQETDRLWIRNYWMPIGFASLALIIIGLIVIWTGYQKKVRWTWFVLLVIVWVFAFPVYMLPEVLDMREGESINWSEWFRNVMNGVPIARAHAKAILNFLLMVVALFLPIKAFFGKQPVPPR